MINDAYTEAKKLLLDNYEILEKVSKSLLERETISGEELNILMAGGELEPLKPLESVEAKGLEELKKELVSEGKIISDEVVEVFEKNNVTKEEEEK
jgi:cell division protease FtsH